MTLQATDRHGIKHTLELALLAHTNCLLASAFCALTGACLIAGTYACTAGLAFLAFGLNMVDCGNILGQRLRPVPKKVTFSNGLVAADPIERTYTL